MPSRKIKSKVKAHFVEYTYTDNMKEAGSTAMYQTAMSCVCKSYLYPLILLGLLVPTVHFLNKLKLKNVFKFSNMKIIWYKN